MKYPLYERLMAMLKKDVATEETIKSIDNKTVKSFSKYPTPGTLTDIQLTSVYNIHSGRQLVCMDKHNTLYSLHQENRIISKSTDFGETWKDVITIPLEYSTIGDGTIQVTDTGRILVGMQFGQIIVTDELQTSFTLVYKFDEGRPRRSFDYSIHGNIIVLGAYGGFSSNAIPAHQVILSQDYGATFKLIFDKNNAVAPIKDTVNTIFHFHDVEYDEYSKRIWITAGDTVNQQTFYSDDMGGTWNKIFTSTTPAHQYTSILPLPHGVVFGTDCRPDGLHYWKRDSRVIQPNVKEQDFESFYLFDNKGNFGHVAHKPYVYRDKDTTIYLIPFFVGVELTTCPNKATRILASTDGYNWFEIYRNTAESANTDCGFLNIVGVCKIDSDLKVFANFQKGSVDTAYADRYWFTATLPSWK